MSACLLLAAAPALATSAVLGGCGDATPAAPAPPRVIEARAAGGEPRARVVAGRPCRATIDGVDLIVGTRPLVAQQGAVRWTGEAGAEGAAFARDGAPAGRLHADQLFDGDGALVMRLGDGGAIADARGAIVRRARATAGGVAVEDLRGGATIEVTGTTDVLVAAVLVAGTLPEVRALAACHLLSVEPKAS